MVSKNKYTPVRDGGYWPRTDDSMSFLWGKVSNFSAFSCHLLSAPIISNLETSLPFHPSQFNLLSHVQGEGSQFPYTHVRIPNYQLAIKEAHSQNNIIIQLCESQENDLFPWCWHRTPHQRGWYLFQIIIPWWLINLTIFLFCGRNKRNLCLHFMAIYHSSSFQIARLRSKENGRSGIQQLNAESKTWSYLSVF